MLETGQSSREQDGKVSVDYRRQVVSKLLKLFFEKEINKPDDSNDSCEKIEKEININIKGSIKGPDRFGNYVMSFDGKKILLDENLDNITRLEFVGIMPYNDRYYICDIGKKCVFYDTESGDVVEFAEVGEVIRPKIYGEDKLCDDEFLSNLCNKSLKIFSGENEKTLVMGFYAFLNRYYQNILGKDIDMESKMQEVSKFGKECNNIFSFLMGAYEFMYNGRITNFLAGKDSKLWEKLKKSEVLKEMYPDLYLAMDELDFVKNVLLDSNGNIYGYVIIKDGICGYVQMDGTILQYDDFIGPDRNGNIITRQGDKWYFMNSNFRYPFCGFDKIIGPDGNGNYILDVKNRSCFVTKDGKVLSLSKSSDHGNEPDFTNECFSSIDGPDQNNNYLVKSARGYFLVNSNGEKISDIYLLRIEFILDAGNYKASDMSGTFILDSNGKVVQ